MNGRLLACLLLGMLGCATAQPSTHRPDAASLARSLSGVPPAFVPAFEALSQAVDALEDDIARQILERTRLRLAAERGALPADVSRRELRALDSADALADGFARILDGRERVAALDLKVVARDTGEETQLVLRVRSAWPEPLTLRTGPLALQEERLLVSPLGRESRKISILSVSEVDEVAIQADEVLELALRSVRAELPRDAIAGRWEWSLRLGAGAVVDGGAIYPGMRWGVDPARVGRVAAYLPTAAVEPHELVQYLERPDLTVPPSERVLPPIMERAVRIEVGRREEALRALVPFLERATEEQIARAVPALRWLAGSSGAGSDPLAWKRWARTLEERSPPATTAAIDLPAPGRRRR